MGVALAEVFTMGVKAGVDPLDLWEAVRQGATGRARTFDRLAASSSPASYDPADFALRLLHKDVSLAVGSAARSACRCVSQSGVGELNEALNRGWGTRDSRVGCCRSSGQASSRSPSIPRASKRCWTRMDSCGREAPPP